MKNLVGLVVTVLLAMTGDLLQAAYECPYSGPDSEAELVYDVQHYLLDLTIVYPDGTELGKVEGTARLECRSRVSTLTSIQLDLLSTENSEVLSVTLDGYSILWTFSGDVISIAPEDPLEVNQPFSLEVNYRVKGLAHFQFRPKDDARFAFNAMVENSRWFPCLHDPRDKATYEFRIRVADDKVVAANGIKQSETDNGDGTKTFVWIESDPMASYLATLNIADYAFFVHDYHGMQIVYYVIPELVEEAQFDFENDGSILDFFISSFGPYPFDKLGLAQVPLGGAMENQDMISFGSGLIQGNKAYEGTYAHEVSHMWWGDSVTLSDCRDVWLNEGFASYCEPLWEQDFYGEERFRTTMDGFRESYFDEDASHRYSIYDPETVWSATTYDKAAWVLHMLRWVVGEPDFWTILQDYYDRYKFSNATTADFQAVCETHYGKSLEWFFNQWIYDKGFPEFELDYRIDRSGNRAIIWIDQIQQNAPDIFEMPVEISLLHDGSTSSEIVWLNERTELFAFKSDYLITGLVFDSNGWILYKSEWIDRPDQTGVTLALPERTFRAGDAFSLHAAVTVAEDNILIDCPLFVILGILGNYYFAPSFNSQYDNFLNQHPVFETGTTIVEAIPEIVWPEDAGEFSGAVFYGAVTNEDISALIGELDMVEFGWE